MNIAIIDDDKIQRFEIKELLFDYFQESRLCRLADPSITEYSSGEEFLLDFCQDKFQLILLDIYMKDLNGIEVAARLREIDKKCSIVLITSSCCLHIPDSLNAFVIRSLIWTILSQGSLMIFY